MPVGTEINKRIVDTHNSIHIRNERETCDNHDYEKVSYEHPQINNVYRCKICKFYTMKEGNRDSKLKQLGL